MPSIVGMRAISQQISAARKELGLTQGGLAALAEISLATVQNIEAGRANPSMGTLERILSVLGLELGVQRAEVDWDMLAALGIPLQRTGGPTVQPSPEALHIHLRHALVELGSLPAVHGKSRELEATIATVYALKHHFPSYFARHFGRSSVVRSFETDGLPGRVVKLSRIAADNLARYL